MIQFFSKDFEGVYFWISYDSRCNIPVHYSQAEILACFAKMTWVHNGSTWLQHSGLWVLRSVPFIFEQSWTPFMEFALADWSLLFHLGYFAGWFLLRQLIAEHVLSWRIRANFIQPSTIYVFMIRELKLAPQTIWTSICLHFLWDRVGTRWWRRIICYCLSC